LVIRFASSPQNYTALSARASARKEDRTTLQGRRLRASRQSKQISKHEILEVRPGRFFDTRPGVRKSSVAQ
jgi:hypothetical protein